MDKIIKELQENIHQILEVMSDELLIADGEGRVLVVSSSFEEFYGLSKESVVGRTVYELETEGFFKPSIIAQVLSKKEKLTLPQKSNMGRHILVTATPIFGKNKSIKLVVSYARDITEMIELQRQMSKYTAEIEELRKDKEVDREIIATSVQMESIMETINRVADFDVNVLLTGPSGTGKTLLAKSIHNKSSRSSGPFVDINCAAIPENLLESELFGYEKGAFTGANANGKKGLIEMADKGTLLLDEISEMPLTLQAKLLKAIQDKTITKVGGTEKIKVDFRLLAASNRPLDRYSEEGMFRKDLYYRLNIVNIKIPPLTERKDDILPLIEYYTERFNKQYGLNKSFSPRAKNALLKYAWPGNVRELSNAIERAMVTSISDVIKEKDLPEELRSGFSGSERYQIDYVNDLSAAVEDLERVLVTEAYKKYGTTIGVAKHLNISQPTAFRKINKYINPKEEQGKE